MAKAPALRLSGERCVLRTATADDAVALIAIRSTPEVYARWRGEDLAAEFADELHDDDVVMLTIEDQAGVIVGLIQFAEEADEEYRRAGIDIYIDPQRHREGLAFDAISTVVAYLFDVRKHHRLTIDPAASNEAAIACYRKVGFQPVGVMREYELQADGTWADGLLMDMLASDR